jgi:large subunit ribosomal protein L22
MTASKTNERPGTRAKASHVRSSAYKAREILNLIRGKSYAEASEILAFSERGISEDIAKVLDSAVANAEHNDGQLAEELFVSACYADEGPTLKRWRPRARGRATRIRKRTCHITVIVSRFSDEQLEALRAKEANAGRSTTTNAAEARRRRVEQSREREEAREAEEDHDHDHDDHDHDHEASTEEKAAEVVAATAAEMEAAGDDYDADKADSDADSIVDADDESPFGPLSHAPLDDSSEAPEGYPIKGNANSMKYHQPDGRWFEQTVAEVWFATTDAAEAAGFTEAGASSDEGADETSADSANADEEKD